jgi:hypothetical protein
MASGGKKHRSKSGEHDADLDDWTPVYSTGCFDPARPQVRLVGLISNDRRKRFPDGRSVYTSAVRSLPSAIAEGAIVRTKNTRYRLLKRSTRVAFVIE